MDEHDKSLPLLSVLDEGSVLVDARLEVEKLEEHYNVNLPDGEFESVGGFIIHILGKIPEVGETLEDVDYIMNAAMEVTKLPIPASFIDAPRIALVIMLMSLRTRVPKKPTSRIVKSLNAAPYQEY